MQQPKSGSALSLADDLARLSADWEGWTIWRNDVGHWYATRHATLTLAELDAGRAQTVEAEDAEGLAAALARQAVTS